MARTHRHIRKAKYNRIYRPAWLAERRLSWSSKDKDGAMEMYYQEFPEQRYYHWAGATPSWWNRLFHTRPNRRNDKDLCKKVEREGFDEDKHYDWSHPRKPHNYYW
jgi:hypothetical protein